MSAGEPAADRAPLLATKLHPPRRRRALVPRPRLAALADRRHPPALTLVSAPAGFGKTTLVADWFAGGAVAWVSLDARDDDPSRFWAYVIAALELAAPDLRSDAAALLEPAGAPLEVVVSTLINDLETAAHDVVLVLDDYHLVTAAEIHESITFLLAHLPPQLRLVLVTRADPPLPLASLRADGDLLEIRAADLRFTEDEADAYFREVMDLSLSTGDVAVLDARTEGWIAALQLAALSMRGRDDPSSFVTEFAGDDRFILDYLTDEVLERQTPAVRDFLLATSILTRLNAPLCDAVTGQQGSKAMLDQLERSNLFVVPLDDRRNWYRYHHLFGDVLRARLLDEQPERVAELHRRASDRYAADGELYEAITHAFAAGDVVRAATLLERVAPEMQRRRQENRLRAWLDALPAEVYADRPVLAMACIGARMSTGDATGLDPLFAIVDAGLTREARPVVIDEDAYRRLPAMVAVHRAGLALLAGDNAAAMRHASSVLELAGPGDQLQRGAAAALVGLAHWARGELDAARERYVESVACFETGGYLPDVMGCSLALADIQLTQGRLRDAERTFTSALAHTIERPGLRGAADMHVGLALLAIEHDDLDAAAEHLRIAAELGDHLGLPQHPYRRRVAAARYAQVQGDLDTAHELLVEAAAVYNTDFSPPVRPVVAMVAAVAAARGELSAAFRWAEAHHVGPDDELAYAREFEHLTLARLLLARGAGDDVARARAVLGRLRDAAAAGGRAGSLIEILVVLARAEVLAGFGDAARVPLADALRLAEPESYVRTFLDAGAEVVALLRAVEGDAAAYAARLVAASRAPGAATVAGPRVRTTDPDELSDRELDVLRLLRSDLSGPEIARALHVSLNTLRTHTKHIYTKLAVTNRREALTRARELGL